MARGLTLIRSLPTQGWVGLVVAGLYWYLNWNLPGAPTLVGFFPLWVGYCLAVDGLVYALRGDSLLTRGPAAYSVLFVVSVPAWWFFEAINTWAVRNWEYTAVAPRMAEAIPWMREAILQNWQERKGDTLSFGEYALTASVSFSTVVPAVFGTAELVGTSPWLRRVPKGPSFPAGGPALAVFSTAGAVMLLSLFLWPETCYPLTWLSVFLVIDPLNAALGQRSLLREVASGDWRTVLALSIGALVCGFFWEMWNSQANPKWVYHTPHPESLDPLYWKPFGFEMPLVGYLGYLPFAWELFAMYHLLAGLTGPRRTQRYLQVVLPADPGRSPSPDQ